MRNSTVHRKLCVSIGFNNSSQGYYKRSNDYKAIQLRHMVGCFPVALVHSTVLIDLRREESTNLAFHPPPPGYSGPFDDIIRFAHSAIHHNVPMHILNTDFFGYMLMPMESENTIEDEKEQFLHLKLENISELFSLVSFYFIVIVMNIIYHK